MTRLFFSTCGLFLLGACAAVISEIDADARGYYDENGMFIAYCSSEPAPVIFTKEGFPIIDDQACIPEPEVLGIQIFNDPPADPPADDPPADDPPADDPPADDPPADDPPADDPPADDPPADEGKCNSGRGNGSETDPDSDCDPGNSGGRNQGGD